MPTYNLTFATWSQTDFGYQAWASPSNAETTDGAFAEATCDAINGTETLIGTGTISSVPAASEILVSIVMTVQRLNGIGFGDPIHDKLIQLVKGGAPTGPNKASATNWPYVSAAATYTWTATDLSGAGIGAGDVASSTFGVSLAAIGSAGGIADVDSITLTVTTQLPSPLGSPLFVPPYSTQGA